MQNNDDRLKLYIISSHVDKPLGEDHVPSVYECPIQAGAALTEKRICELNDYDGFAESISERNARYCEATAMWWIGNHIDTPYVGIEHYRRRLKLTDEQIAGYMDDGVDVITSVPQKMQWSVKDDYKAILYAGDWDLFMGILRTYASEDAAFAEDCFSKDTLYSCNIGIFRSDLYKEYCDWAFPILDEFYRRSPVKTDIYQRRDVGFIAERLTHLFICRMIERNKRVVEAEMINLRSASSYTTDEEICDRTDPAEVYRVCDRLYRDHHIGKCAYLLAEASEQNALDERLMALEEVLGVAEMESDHYSQTMHDYLPPDMRSDTASLVGTYGRFRTLIREYLTTGDERSYSGLKDYISVTHFSRIAAACICGLDGADQDTIDGLIGRFY